MDKKISGVVGYFHSQQELSRCVEELRSVGFSASNIKTFISDPESERPVTILGKIQKNAGIETGFAGSGIGAAVGSMLGFIFGSGYLDFFYPGSSRSLNLSPYLSVGVGAAVGAAFGGVGGAYMGHKIPEESLMKFEHLLVPGEIRVSVSSENEAQVQLAKFILAEFGATHISSKLRELQPGLIYQKKNKSKKARRRQQMMHQHL